MMLAREFPRLGGEYATVLPACPNCGRPMHLARTIPGWGGLALGRPKFGSPCAFSISYPGAAAAAQPLGQCDAFGLHADQNGRALGDDQSLLPEP